MSSSVPPSYTKLKKKLLNPDFHIKDQKLPTSYSVKQIGITFDPSNIKLEILNISGHFGPFLGLDSTVFVSVHYASMLKPSLKIHIAKVKHIIITELVSLYLWKLLNFLEPRHNTIAYNNELIM